MQWFFNQYWNEQLIKLLFDISCYQNCFNPFFSLASPIHSGTIAIPFLLPNIYWVKSILSLLLHFYIYLSKYIELLKFHCIPVVIISFHTDISEMDLKFYHLFFHATPLFLRVCVASIFNNNYIPNLLFQLDHIKIAILTNWKFNTNLIWYNRSQMWGAYVSLIVYFYSYFKRQYRCHY